MVWLILCLILWKQTKSHSIEIIFFTNNKFPKKISSYPQEDTNSLKMLEKNTIHFGDTQKTNIKSFEVKPISRRIVIQSFPKVIPRRKIVSQVIRTYVSLRNVEKNLIVVQFSPQHFQRKRNPNRNKCLKPMIKPFPSYLSREFGNTWFLRKNVNFFGSSLRNPT